MLRYRHSIEKLDGSALFGGVGGPVQSAGVSVHFDEVQQEALARLRRRLDEIERLEAHERPRVGGLALSGSVLAEDDSKAKPFRLSQNVGHALALSLDALTGVRLLLRDPAAPEQVRLLMAAPYSMLRTAVEAGALGAWILLAEESDERVRRSLRSAWSDIQNGNLLRRTYGKLDPDDARLEIQRKQHVLRANHREIRELKSAFHPVAAAVGLVATRSDQRLPGFEALVADTAFVTGVSSSTAAVLWRTLSGLTHPSASRTLSASLVETTESDDPEVLHATFIARPDLLDTATSAALGLHVYMLRRIAELGGNEALRFHSSFAALQPAV